MLAPTIAAHLDAAAFDADAISALFHPNPLWKEQAHARNPQARKGRLVTYHRSGHMRTARKQIKENDMTQNEVERRKAIMEGDFNPGHTRGAMPEPDLRLANAAEYAAYQLGQINRNLAKLVEILEKRGS